jgi:hypothetical protein
MQISRFRTNGTFYIGRYEVYVAIDLDYWALMVDGETDSDGAVMHHLRVGPFSVTIAFMPD